MKISCLAHSSEQTQVLALTPDPCEAAGIAARCSHAIGGRGVGWGGARQWARLALEFHGQTCKMFLLWCVIYPDKLSQLSGSSSYYLGTLACGKAAAYLKEATLNNANNFHVSAAKQQQRCIHYSFPYPFGGRVKLILMPVLFFH